MREIITQRFTILPTAFDESFYTKYVLRRKELLDLENELGLVPHLQHQFDICMNHHASLSSSSAITACFDNLMDLQHEVKKLKTSTETLLFEILDRYPDRAEVQLRLLVRKVRTITL